MMIKYQFHAEEATYQCIKWIRTYFDIAHCDKAVVGISGGKDSSVVAALCVAALGKDRVIGVMMPQGTQLDIDYSYALINHLGIQGKTVCVKTPVNEILEQMNNEGITPSQQTQINLPARIRMATLFAIAQSVNGRVANTCNLSENWVGYSTLFGDDAGQFAPIAQFTVEEVKAIGRVLGLPEYLIEKMPSDGLCGKSDEDNLGFSYAVLDRYIRIGICEDIDTRKKIDQLHWNNLFKKDIVNIPCFHPAPTLFLSS